MSQPPLLELAAASGADLASATYTEHEKGALAGQKIRFI